MCRQHRDCGLKKSEGCGSLGLEIVGTSILGLWTVLEGPPWEMGARALSQGPCLCERGQKFVGFWVVSGLWPLGKPWKAGSKSLFPH